MPCSFHNSWLVHAAKLFDFVIFELLYVIPHGIANGSLYYS